MFKGFTILLACCAFFAKAQQVYVVSPNNTLTDTIHICSSDPFPILEAGEDNFDGFMSIEWRLNGSVISNAGRLQTSEVGTYTLSISYLGDTPTPIEKTVVVDMPIPYICEIIIPNVFTPNGDGKNDTFTILNLEHYPKSSLTVYTRWGRKVFENTNYRNDWDGSNLENGSYYFILKRNDGQEFKGSVTILR